MRKILIGVITLFVVIIAFLFAYKGINTFFTVYSLDEISNKQEDVNNKITEIKSSQKSLKTILSEISESAETFEKVKSQYDDLVRVASSEDKKEAILGDYYDIEYLWTKLGIYSTENGVDISLTISRSSFGVSTSEYQMCDFSFEVVGGYRDVAEYIQKLEDDTDLKFTIKNFKMVASDSSKVKGSFTVESIPVAASSLSSLNNGAITISSNGGSTNSTDNTNSNTNSNNATNSNNSNNSSNTNSTNNSNNTSNNNNNTNSNNTNGTNTNSNSSSDSKKSN